MQSAPDLLYTVPSGYEAANGLVEARMSRLVQRLRRACEAPYNEKCVTRDKVYVS